MPDEFEPKLIREDFANDHRPPFGKASPGIFWLIFVILLIIAAFSVVHFGSLQPTVSPTPTSSDLSASISNPPRIYTVSYNSGVFSPTNLRIHAGDTVKFKNDSIFPIHIVSDDLVGLDSTGDIPQGSFFSFTFAAKGTFSYYNQSDPNQTGMIIVR